MTSNFVKWICSVSQYQTGIHTLMYLLAHWQQLPIMSTKDFSICFKQTLTNPFIYIDKHNSIHAHSLQRIPGFPEHWQLPISPTAHTSRCTRMRDNCGDTRINNSINNILNVYFFVKLKVSQPLENQEEHVGAAKIEKYWVTRRNSDTTINKDPDEL